ncbi:MAG: hypothetical protein H7329_00185 [Opitutaceae bacterium]|nr:hypothetical protein [Cytophagales bacterium]
MIAQPHSHTNTAGGFVRFKKKKRYWSVGATFQAMNYVGDLDPAANPVSPALRFTQPNFGGIVSYRYSPRITYRGTFSWGRIKGDDKVSSPSGNDQFRRMRNSNFRNTIVELKFDVVYDFVKNLGDYTKRPTRIIPFMFVGVAGFYHNPKGEKDGKWIALQPLQTEGVKYSKFQVAIPFGLGARIKLSNNWDLAFEIGWRKTFTGYLDDVNKDYVDPKSQSGLSAEMTNKSVLWINQPSDPSKFANSSQGELKGFIKEGAPNIAADRIYYNPETNRLEFHGWGQNGDQRGKHGGKTDWYILTGFHLTYIIGGRIVCPKFRD